MKLSRFFCFLLSLLLLPTIGFGQKFKDRLKNATTKDNSEIYECGYVYEPSLKDKMNLMKAVQKSIGGGATQGGQPDLGGMSISVFYGAHLHPQSIMRYPTQTPGWETCGDAVFLGITNRDGVGFSDTDGQVVIDGQVQEKAGMGTYFMGFDPGQRGEKSVKITSSDGDVVQLEIGPAAPLEILTIDGKAKGSEIEIDGTKDIVIELANGDADPHSDLHVQLICKLVGTPIMYDLIVTSPKNRIVIPKAAFKNFEGSPAPFSKSNTLIVNRVKETIHSGTDAGAIRSLSQYMDWAPVSMGGDIAKGNMITMGFDSSKNTQIKLDFRTQGEYQFSVSKGGPYSSPPVSYAKKVAIGSLIVRGNLEDVMVKDTVIFEDGKILSGTGTMVSTLPPVLNTREAWLGLADRMQAELERELSQAFGWEFLPMSQVTGAKAYREAKLVKNDNNSTFVEVGAHGSRRILQTSQSDLMKDLSITFPGDLVQNRLTEELGVDMLLAITIELEMNANTQSLDPTVHLKAYAPMVSYKTAAEYGGMIGQTEGVRFRADESFSGRAADKLFDMIKGTGLVSGIRQAFSELSEQEDNYPVYSELWEAKR